MLQYRVKFYSPDSVPVTLRMQKAFAEIENGADPEQTMIANNLSIRHVDSLMYHVQIEKKYELDLGRYDFTYNQTKRKKSDIYDSIGDNSYELLEIVNTIISRPKFEQLFRKYQTEQAYKQNLLDKNIAQRQEIAERSALEEREKLEYATAVMKLFIKSDMTKENFTKTVEMTAHEFDNLSKLVKNLSPDFGEELSACLAKNSLRRFVLIKSASERAVENIKSIPSFSTFDHDISEYYDLREISQAALKEKFNGANVIKNFVEKKKFSYAFLDRKKALGENHTIGGYEISTQDKEAVFNFLKLNGLECTNGNYNGALRYYIKNENFPIVAFGAEFQKQRQQQYAELKDQYAELNMLII